MTRDDMARALARNERIKNHVGLTTRDSKIIVQEIFKIMADELAAHGYIRIYGFGILYVKDWGAREYIIPGIEEPVYKEHEYRVMFRASEELKEAVN